MRNIQVLILFLLIFSIVTFGCINKALQHLEQGDIYAEQGQTEQAIEEYSIAIELKPKLSMAYIARGMAYIDSEQWSSAITDLEKAVELDPEQAAALNPELAVAYSNRGYFYNDTEQYDRAFDDLTKALELDPGLACAKTYAGLGKAYLEKDEKELARENYNRAIELDRDVLTGQELADIILRCSSGTTSNSMDMDIIMIAEIPMRSKELSIEATIKVNSVVNTVNKKMRMIMETEVDFPGQGKILQEKYVVDGWLYSYREDSEAEGWTKEKCDDLWWKSQDQFTLQMDLLTTPEDISLLGSEIIDSVDCYVLLITPEFPVMDELISLQQQSETEFGKVNYLMQIETIEVKEWITKDKYLPVKMDLNMVLENIGKLSPKPMYQDFPALLNDIHISMNMNMQVKIGDFNEPVVIELPPEALEAEESPVRY